MAITVKKSFDVHLRFNVDLVDQIITYMEGLIQTYEDLSITIVRWIDNRNNTSHGNYCRNKRKREKLDRDDRKTILQNDATVTAYRNLVSSLKEVRPYVYQD